MSWCLHLERRLNKDEKIFLNTFVEHTLPALFNNKDTIISCTRYRWFLILDFVAVNPEIFGYTFENRCNHSSECGFQFKSHVQVNAELLDFARKERTAYMRAVHGWNLVDRNHADSKTIVNFENSEHVLEFLKFTALHGKCVKLNIDRPVESFPIPK